MVKPTKAKLIQIRDESYREQTVECCGTCRHFISHYMVPHFSGPLKGRVQSRCEAIQLRDFARNVAARKDISYLGICDLYEPREDGQ